MAHDVVICYEYQDKAFADAACAFLESRNIRCWYAARDVSDVLKADETAAEAIRAAKIMAVVFSDASNESAQLLRQLELAADCDLTVIPVKLTETEPSGTMSFYLKPLHWLDATGTGRREAIVQLGDRCAERLGREREIAPARPAPAVEEAAELRQDKGDLLLKSYRFSWLIYMIILAMFDGIWLLLLGSFMKEIRLGYADISKADYMVFVAMIICAAGIVVLSVSRIRRAGKRESFAEYAVGNRREKCTGAVFLYSACAAAMAGITVDGFMDTVSISMTRLFIEAPILALLIYLIIKNARTVKECRVMLNEQESRHRDAWVEF